MQTYVGIAAGVASSASFRASEAEPHSVVLIECDSARLLALIEALQLLQCHDCPEHTLPLRTDAGAQRLK
jgi:hypothetical protein